MSLFKTSMRATTVNVTNLSVSSMLNTNAVFVTNSTVTNTTISNKLVAPATLKYLLQNPPSIGGVTPSTANFNTLVTSSLQGDCVASSVDAIAYGQIPEIITPSTLKLCLQSPPVIGYAVPNSATFTGLSLNSIAGCIANQNQITNSSANNVVLTPQILPTLLQNPPAIGSSTPGAASFTTLNIQGTLTLSTASFTPTEGGTGYTSYTKGDILIGTNSGGLAKLGVGSDGQYLQIDSSATNGVKWGAFSTGSALSSGTTQVNPANNTDAINYNISNQALVPSNLPSIFANISTIGSITPSTAAFTTVSANTLVSAIPLGVAVKGTGIGTYYKGDLLIGNSSNTLTRIPVGNDNQILTIDNLGNIRWSDLPNANTSSGSVIPGGYINFTVPVCQYGTTYYTPNIISKSYDGSVIIDIEQYTFDIATVIATSPVQTGTVSSVGTAVTGTGTTFTTVFIVGDTITVVGSTGGRRIISINSDTSLTLESAFTTTVTGTTFYRGGLSNNTLYFAYANGTAIMLSPRDYLSGDDVVDLNGSVVLYIQVPMKIQCIDVGTSKFSNFVNYEVSYPTKFSNCKEPQYVSNTTYAINSCSARSEYDADNIDVLNKETINLATYGANGLEPSYTLTGTISTNGTLITGSGTQFLTQLIVGDSIMLTGGSKTGKVTSISSNTVLTLDQAIDNGGSVSWTYNGLVSVQTSTKKWGSNAVYLSGNSNMNYLIPSGIPFRTPNTWTLECWVNQPASSNNYVFGKKSNDSYIGAWYSASQIGLLIKYEGTSSDINLSYSSTFTANTWYHIAFVYDGSRYLVYVGGVLKGSTLAGNVKNGFFTDLIIGSQFPGFYYTGSVSNVGWTRIYTTGHNGYMDDIRFSNIARYTSTTYTVPAAGFTTDANTIFLQNFESITATTIPSGGILSDSVAANTWSINNYLQTPTSTYKFGSSCLQLTKFSNSYVTMTGLPTYSSPWTIDFWFNLSSLQLTNTLIANYNTYIMWIYVDNYGLLHTNLSSNNSSWDILSAVGGNVSANTWNHYALIFTGSSYLAYLNGYLVGYISTSTTIVSSAFTNGNGFCIGYYNSGNGNYMDGYIDEFRVSNNARYSYPSLHCVDDISTVLWGVSGTPGISSTSKFGTGALSVTPGNSETLNSTIPISPWNNPIVSSLPSSLTNWYDASSSNTIGSNNVFNILTVTDKSGNNNTATYTGTAPTNGYTLNGRAAAYFSNNGYLSFTGIGTSATTWTMIFVFQSLSSSTPQYICSTTSSPSNAVALYMSNQFYGGVNGNNNYVNPGIPTYQPVIVSIVYPSAGSGTSYFDVYINQTFSNHLPAATTNLGSIDIGGSSGKAGLVGMMGEYQLYNTNLSSSQLQNVEYYLSKKWGISGPIASGSIPVSGTTSSNFPSGLRNWYDFSDSTKVNGLSKINDLSGNYKFASISATGSGAPVITSNAINSLPAMYFGGSGKQFLNAPGPGLYSAYTIIMVVNFTTLADTATLFYTDGSQNTSSTGLSLNSSYNLLYYVYNSSVASGNAISSGTTYIVTIVDSGTSVTIYLNGSSSLTSTSFSGVSNRNIANLDIGGWSGSTSNTMNGYIGEFQAYNNALASGSRQNVEWYLAQKWGVSGPTSSGSIPTSGTIVSNLPTGITNWYDFSITTFSKSLPNISTSGVGSLYLNDLSGNNNSLSNGSWGGSTNPAISSGAINSLSAIHFSGAGNNGLVCNGPGYIAAFTMIMVMKFSAFSGSQFFSTDGNWQSGSIHCFLYGNTRWDLSENNGSDYAPGTTPSTGVTYIVTYVDAGPGATATIYINGTSIGSTSNFTGLATRNFTGIDIGGWSLDTGRTMNGYVGEFQLYTNALSTTNRQNVEYYLAQKWGVSGLTSSGSIPVSGTQSSNLPSGLSNWYDFSLTTGPASSTPSIVSYLTDKSNIGNNAGINPIYSGNPSYTTNAINGLGAYSFNGNGNNFLSAIGPGTLSTGYTATMVVKYNSVSASQVLLSSSSFNNYSWTQSYGTQLIGATPISYSVYNTSTQTTSTSPSTGTTYVITIIDNITSTNIYVNGNLIWSSTNASGIAYRNLGGINIGGWIQTSGNTLNGYLGEFQMYSTPITTLQRQYIENYLMAKWGVTALPSNPTIGSPYPWTVECWFYCTTVGINNAIMGNASIINIFVNTSNQIQFQLSSNTSSFDVLDITSTTTISPNTWNHVALVFNGTNYYGYLNGVVVGSSNPSLYAYYFAMNNTFTIGAYSTNGFTGYIDEFRVSNNVRYPGGTTFTPSTSAFSIDANTLSLQHFDVMIGDPNKTVAQFIDSVSTTSWNSLGVSLQNNFISKFGNSSFNVLNGSAASINPGFIPYVLNNISTSSPTNFPAGLSVWLDASQSSSLTLSGTNISTIADLSGSGKFGTVYNAGSNPITYNSTGFNGLGCMTFSGTSSSSILTVQGPGSVSSYTTFMAVSFAALSTNMTLFNTMSPFTQTGSPYGVITHNVNFIYSVVLSISSGSYLQYTVYYVNKSATTTVSSVLITINTPYIITMLDLNSSFSIYINGVNLFTSTNNSSVSLRNLSTLNIGGWDGNSANTLNGSIGEVQIYNTALTTTNRSSVEQYLYNKWLPTCVQSNTWTIETWFYCVNLGITNPIFGNSFGIKNSSSLFYVYINSSNAIEFQTSSVGSIFDLPCLNSQNNVVIANTWNHIAMVYDGTTYYAFLNGALISSAISSITVNLNTFNTMQLGYYASNSFNGYFDEFRISKVARYTNTFTPNTVAFSVDSNTISLQHFENLYTASPNFIPPNTQYTVDTNTNILNHFNMGSINLNLGEQTMSSVTGQSFIYSTLCPNKIYYLYVSGGHTPYYMLSSRCYVKGDSLPNGISTSNFRQLPYVFITDSSSNFVPIEWDDIKATIMSPAPLIINRVSGTNQNAIIDLSNMVPYTSTMALLDVKNTTATSITNIQMRDTRYAAYSYIQGMTNSGSNPVQQLTYAPLNNAQTTTLYVNNSTSMNPEVTLVGFFVNYLV